MTTHRPKILGSTEHLITWTNGWEIGFSVNISLAVKLNTTTRKISGVTLHSITKRVAQFFLFRYNERFWNNQAKPTINLNLSGCVDRIKPSWKRFARIHSIVQLFSFRDSESGSVCYFVLRIRASIPGDVGCWLSAHLTGQFKWISFFHYFVCGLPCESWRLWTKQIKIGSFNDKTQLGLLFSCVELLAKLIGETSESVNGFT